MSQLLFELGINLIETFIITAFLTLYLEPKFGKGKALLFFIISWLANFGEICIVNHITIFESVGSYIPICMYFIYAILCLKGNVLLKLLGRGGCKPSACC